MKYLKISWLLEKIESTDLNLYLCSHKTINFSHRSIQFFFVTKYHAEMEDKNLTLEQEAQIKEKAAALKAEKKSAKSIRWLCPAIRTAARRSSTSLTWANRPSRSSRSSWRFWRGEKIEEE